MKRWYVITVALDGIAFTLEAMKLAGFKKDLSYEDWGTPGGKIICGLIGDEDVDRVKAVPGVKSLSPETDVDPFLRRGGGITY